MTLKEWNALQLAEASSETNRYYYHEHYGADPPDLQSLILYYIEYGAAIFSELHKSESYILQQGEDI